MSVPDTKVVRLLQARKISFRLLPHDKSVYTVAEAAAQRGVVKEEMVKSILLRDKNHHYVLACVTGDARLNPKAVRAYLGDEWARLRFASAEEIRQKTGFIQGAVAPLGLPDDVPVIFDESIAQLSRVNISSGDPLAGLELDAQDLITLAGAQMASIAA